MPETIYRSRRAVQLENDRIRVTILVEGGHIAELLDRASGVNPLWTPPWPSIEPSTWDPDRHPEYGNDGESRLLAGLMGHNLCVDMFGGPSAEEYAAGMGGHGESSVVPYQIEAEGMALTARAIFPAAHLAFQRRLTLQPGSCVVHIRETLENLDRMDRPVAWTQHVTLGPPFLERGATQFRAPGTRSKVIESDFTGGKGFQQTAAEFDWPFCPRKDGGIIDLRVFESAPVSGGFTTHLMDPARPHGWFLAWSPSSGVLCGYIWKQSDFPWLGRWEENHLRTHAPWNGQAMTCGMEFGASPMPETRRRMIERGSLFGVPGYRWIPALSRVEVNYCAFVTVAPSIPEDVAWDGAHGVEFIR